MTAGDGSHVSTSDGGFATALAEAARLGASAVQVWVQGNPDLDLADPDQIAAGRRLTASMPTLDHASYDAAITHPIGSPDSDLALAGIREVLGVGAHFGMIGLVIHPGEIRTKVDVQTAVDSLRALAPALAGPVPLLLENTADGLHDRLAVLREIVFAAGVEGVGICLDTAHAYAAGIDFADPAVAAREVAAADGLIRAVHFNNNLYALGSKRDDHEALFSGVLTAAEVESTYRNIVGALPDVPMLIESAREPYEVAALAGWRVELSSKVFATAA